MKVRTILGRQKAAQLIDIYSLIHRSLSVGTFISTKSKCNFFEATVNIINYFQSLIEGFDFSTHTSVIFKI